MYQYFKTLKALADLNPKEYTSIKELTIDVARSGGYRREQIPLKNGELVWRTRYGEEDAITHTIRPTWDDTLVAKWFCHYKNLFISKLYPHPELSEFFEEILQRTFTVYFNSLQIDKLKTDSNVNTVVYMCLANRIGEVLIKIGSVARLENRLKDKKMKYNETSNLRINMKTSINYMSYSLDQLQEDVGFQVPSYEIPESIVAIRTALGGSENDMGLRLLDGLLYSGRKVNTAKIDEYVALNPDELNKDTLKQLSTAWNRIKETLREMMFDDNYDVDVYDWDKKAKFGYSKNSRIGEISEQAM